MSSSTQFQKGLTPWNKGTKGIMVAWNKGKKLSAKHRENLSKSHIGYVIPVEQRKKMGRKGVKNSRWLGGRMRNNCLDCLVNIRIEAKRCRRCASKQRSGPNSSNWKGGITPEHERIRKSLEYKAWRGAVLKRDMWRCLLCSQVQNRENPLEADHIKPFSLYPDLRFEISNGRTLCRPCHRKTKTWGHPKSQLVDTSGV